jgi:hypothetical protein
MRSISRSYAFSNIDILVCDVGPFTFKVAMRIDAICQQSVLWKVGEKGGGEWVIDLNSGWVSGEQAELWSCGHCSSFLFIACCDLF